MCTRSMGVAVWVLWLGPTLAACAADPTLVGWWWFDEGSGTVAFDSSTYRNNGTVTNGPTWVAGKFGQALRFDGIDDYVQVPNSPSLCVTDGVTVMAWINTTRWETSSGAGYQGLLGKSENPRSYNFYTVPAGTAGGLHFSVVNATTNTQLGAISSTSVPLTRNQWIHVCAMVNGGVQMFYINGVAAGSANSGIKLPGTADTAAVVIGRTTRGADRSFQGLMDDVRIYNRGLTQAEVQQVMTGADLARGIASVPSPADGATDVPRDTPLTWQPGAYAGTHDVYFGTALADVNNASRTAPNGVLVSQGQADPTFDPPGALAYGQTYYWRIDEVNKSADGTINKGGVWSFTVEPYAYTLPGAAITATASSAGLGTGPENTINGSGLAGDLHGTNGMWTTNPGLPAWIQYQFDQTYKLSELKVWNYNGVLEAFMGFGAKDVKIEYSTDGTTWTALANVPQFARAPGMPNYAANTTISFGGVTAQYVKLTINTNWGGMSTVTGLSEVRFSYVPVQARAPQPATGATGQSVTPTLSWRPGREAGSHQVFFGTDPNAVAQGTVAAQIVTGHACNPGTLNYGTTYYWRVDEVNAATSTYPGDVWSFTTTGYGVVDDFESYTDKTGEEIYSTWTDGYTDGKSGSFVGNDPTAAQLAAGTGHFAETTIIHGGVQSMPIKYDNTGTFSFSEAARTFTPAQNWAVSGIKSLSLWFCGLGTNTGGQLYLKINSVKVPYNGNAADITKAAWTPWNIDLSTVSGLSQVNSLTIGIEGAGSKGTLYIDDIRLYPQTPQYLTPIDPGKANLVAFWALNGDAKDSSGKGNNGTINGATAWTTGETNPKALQFDGTSTWVDCGTGTSLNITDGVTIVAWIKLDNVGADRKIAGNQDNVGGGYKMGVYSNNKVEFEVRTAANATANNRSAAGGTALQQGTWYHVAGVYSKAQYFRTFVYGSLDRELATTLTAGSSTVSFKLGRETYGTGGAWWLGAMNDVAVYNRALAPEEILWLAGQTTPVAKPFN